MGDKSARQPNNPGEQQLSFGQMVKLCCYYATKYDTKVNIHSCWRTTDFKFNNEPSTNINRCCIKKTEASNYSIDKCIKWVSNIA
jgi:hypothetical protein